MRCSFIIELLQWVSAGALLATSSVAHAAPPETLPQTTTLDWPEEDLSSRMMDGAHQFVERQIAEASSRRTRYWNYDRSSAPAWEASIQENRE